MTLGSELGGLQFSEGLIKLEGFSNRKYVVSHQTI